MYKIVCVEDDINLSEQLKIALERFNYQVFLIDDFTKTVEIINNINPDLIIMDINLPKFDGFYFTRHIRATTNIPIIFMSSRDEKLEKLMALSIGGDDYITKPIDLELTITKIQSLLRRTYDYALNNEKRNDNIIEGKDGLILDKSKVMIGFQGQGVSLSKNEFIIALKLFDNKGHFVTREEFMNFLWDNDSFIDDNAFNANMSRLRKKIVHLTSKDYIITKRSVGYCLE
jgi:DNA-binding response OmpR family regulator